MPHLTPHLKAGYAGIALITHEEIRSFAWLQHTATEAGYSLREWNAVDGLINHADDPPTCTATEAGLEELLAKVLSMPPKTLLILREVHLLLENQSAFLIRQFKRALQFARGNEITLVLVMPEFRLPLDLQKCFTVMDFDLPAREDILAMMEELIRGSPAELNRRLPEGEALDIVIDAAAGLTAPEAEDALALSLLGNTTFDPAVVLHEKAATLRKNGLVEYIEPKLNLADVGGWDAFKTHISAARLMFSREAAAYARGGPMAYKGDLLAGQAGTGKTLISAIIGSVLQIPVLRVRLDGLRDSKLGGTEANWRSVYKLAKSLGRCLLHLDEPDGLFSAHNTGGGDSGTTLTLIKAIMQDIQESEGIYWVLTANDIDCLPGPLIDRLNLWSVDLPNDTERGEIFQIKMRANGRAVKDVCPKGLMEVVKRTDGFSGRQIERVWLKAMNLAATENFREPLEKDILAALQGEVPTAVAMKDEIDARRKRLEGRARPVTSPTLKKLMTSRDRAVAG